ncbi:MAG: lysine exporter LysO family protein, partial [Sphaerochaeta sp.]|nr:lysine exporter LysO family protein [Sphaerochaeta sp.]
METLLYLAKLALALVLGMGSAHLLGKERFTHVSAYAQMFLVWLLLFFMGVNTGGIDGITSQFGTIGITALLITLFGVAGTILVALFFSFIL